MTQIAVLDRINRHVEAVLMLSKRDVLWRLITEAELCIERNQVDAAAILAGIALEELSSSVDLNLLAQSRPNLEGWRELRRRTVCSTSDEKPVEAKAISQMVMGLRAMLRQVEETEQTTQSRPLSKTEVSKVSGKYAFVPTSVDDFLKHKRDDLQLENCE